MFNENNQAIFYNIIRHLIKQNYEPIPFTNARQSSARTVHVGLFI